MATETLDPTTERNHEGAWVVYTTVGGCLMTRRYYGYTKRDAIAMFKREARQLGRL